MRRVIVVGGGISGLSTAHAILARDPSADVTLLEGSPRLGGNIVTARDDGYVLDGGPDSWVANKPEATALARAVGLEGELIGTVPENRRALIAWGERLYPLPEGFVLGVPTSVLPILRTPLFSMRAKLRMALEPFVPQRRDEGGDESIDAFVRRRLGGEVAERLVAPLLGGIYGGDAGALSMRATLPQFLALEAKHGSLIRGMRATQAPVPRGSTRPSMFTSLRGGVGLLVDRVGSAVGSSRIRLGVRVVRVAPLSADTRGRFAVELDSGETLHADHVVVAVPAHVAGSLLCAFDKLPPLLAAMPYVSTAVVAMAFARSDIAHPLDATGYIVPRAPGRPALAATWISSKWAGRAPDGQALLRVFLGGAGQDAVVDKDDAELETLARAELRRSIGLAAAPSWARVFRFVRASPQPLVGHPERMRQTRALLAETPGLHLVASGYDGVGIPDCIRQAAVVAGAVVA